jgi:hypothetical protein
MPDIVDVACVALLLVLFQRALAVNGLAQRSQAGFLLLGVGQAGLALTFVSGENLGLLLLGAYLLGSGLRRLEHGPLEQAYLALATAMPVLALAGTLGLMLTLLSPPAALLIRRMDRRRRFTVDLLLLGFPLACTLLALGFMSWTTPGALPVATMPEQLAVPSNLSAWARLVSDRFLLPFVVIVALLLVAAPGQLLGSAHALRVLTLTIAGGSAFMSLLHVRPALGAVLALGAAIALLCAVSLIDAHARTKAAIGLVAALCGGWMLVVLKSPQFGIGPTILALWQDLAAASTGINRTDANLDEQSTVARPSTEHAAEADRKGAEPIHAPRD